MNGAAAGTPPFGDVHVSLWHQDARDNCGIDDAWGVAVTPTLQLIIDPVRNPDQDEVVVLGVRSRIAF